MTASVDAQLIVLEGGQTQLGNTLANMYADPDATLNIWKYPENELVNIDLEC